MATERVGQGPTEHDTVHLLRFLDFVYAVVFGHFVQAVYRNTTMPADPPFVVADPIIPGIPLNGDALHKLALSGLAFWFVALDWLDARLTTERQKYQRFSRFFLDLVIAFVSYGILMRAAQGHIGAAGYVAVVYFLGFVWTDLCIREKPTETMETKLRITWWTHGLSTVTFGLLYFFFRTQSVPNPIATLYFAILLFISVLADDALHARYIAPKDWIGPASFPGARDFFYRHIAPRPQPPPSGSS